MENKRKRQPNSWYEDFMVDDDLFLLEEGIEADSDEIIPSASAGK